MCVEWVEQDGKSMCTLNRRVMKRMKVNASICTSGVGRVECELWPSVRVRTVERDHQHDDAKDEERPVLWPW